MKKGWIKELVSKIVARAVHNYVLGAFTCKSFVPPASFTY